jgi:hypothetical protein
MSEGRVKWLCLFCFIFQYEIASYGYYRQYNSRRWNGHFSIGGIFKKL